MKVNDIYRLVPESFPAPAESVTRLVVIRAFDNNFVSFSVASEEQPKLNHNVVVFYPGFFTLARCDFERIHEPLTHGYVVNGGAL